MEERRSSCSLKQMWAPSCKHAHTPRKTLGSEHELSNRDVLVSVIKGGLENCSGWLEIQIKLCWHDSIGQNASKIWSVGYLKYYLQASHSNWNDWRKILITRSMPFQHMMMWLMCVDKQRKELVQHLGGQICAKQERTLESLSFVSLILF